MTATASRKPLSTLAKAHIWAQNQGICGICREPVALEDVHIDHITPLARGGNDSFDNLQVAHPECNARKGARLHPPDPELDNLARIDMRMIPELRRQIRMAAAAEDVGLGEWVKRACEEKLARGDASR